jgi:hypothetical protein
MSDFKAGEKPILYEVVKDGFRYITTGTPDGTEESIAEYRRADLPLTLEQLNSDPRVKALLRAAIVISPRCGPLSINSKRFNAALARFKKDPS